MPTLALLTWPIFAVIIFAVLRVDLAIIWAVLIPYMYLPEAFSIRLSGLPDINKPMIMSLGLLLSFVIFARSAKNAAVTEQVKVQTERTNPLFRVLVMICVMIVVIAPVLTVLNNREVLVYGPRVLSALQGQDAIGVVVNSAFVLTPYFFARRYLATPQMHTELLVALAISGIMYSFLMLVEIRLSPQLHNWVYGYHQHSFSQHIRDGYRPKVFLEHGLWVGFFMFSAVIAAAALWKAGQGIKWLFAALWLFAILLISKNLGAVVIAVIMLGLLFMTPRRVQVWAVFAIALSILLYPALRQAKLVPIEQITAMAAKVSPHRASSLKYRLDNEDILLAWAYKKPVTGWGKRGRNQVYSESGKVVSVSEGRWILSIGSWGWVGYIGLFGLLTLPVLFLGTAARRKNIPPETIALALIIAGNLIYMIPNATLTAVGWLVFGALTGFVWRDVKKQAPEKASEPAGKAVKKYTRFARS